MATSRLVKTGQEVIPVGVIAQGVVHVRRDVGRHESILDVVQRGGRQRQLGARPASDGLLLRLYTIDPTVLISTVNDQMTTIVKLIVTLRVM